MNRARSHGIPIGLLIGTLVAVAMGVVTLSGFSSFPTGDLPVSSTTWATNLLLAFGAAVMLGCEVVRGRRRRPTRVGQAAHLSGRPRSWMP